MAWGEPQRSGMGNRQGAGAGRQTRPAGMAWPRPGGAQRCTEESPRAAPLVCAGGEPVLPHCDRPARRRQEHAAAGGVPRDGQRRGVRWGRGCRRGEPQPLLLHPAAAASLCGFAHPLMFPPPRLLPCWHPAATSRCPQLLMWIGAATWGMPSTSGGGLGSGSRRQGEHAGAPPPHPRSYVRWRRPVLPAPLPPLGCLSQGAQLRSGPWWAASWRAA